MTLSALKDLFRGSMEWVPKLAASVSVIWLCITIGMHIMEIKIKIVDKVDKIEEIEERFDAKIAQYDLAFENQHIQNQHLVSQINSLHAKIGK